MLAGKLLNLTWLTCRGVVSYSAVWAWAPTTWVRAPTTMSEKVCQIRGEIGNSSILMVLWVVLTGSAPLNLVCEVTPLLTCRVLLKETWKTSDTNGKKPLVTPAPDDPDDPLKGHRSKIACMGVESGGRRWRVPRSEKFRRGRRLQIREENGPNPGIFSDLYGILGVGWSMGNCRRFVPHSKIRGDAPDFIKIVNNDIWWHDPTIIVLFWCLFFSVRRISIILRWLIIERSRNWPDPHFTDIKDARDVQLMGAIHYSNTSSNTKSWKTFGWELWV